MLFASATLCVVAHAEACHMENVLAERTISGLHSALVDDIRRVCPRPPVLDIGCGTGAWLERLAHEGFSDLHGIDRDTAQFKATSAKCVAANVDDSDVQLDGSYGLITAIEVIEHLENPGRLFKLVSKHLASDGVFIMTTPNVLSLAARVRFLLKGDVPSFDGKGDPTHLFPVLPIMLARVLPRHSLTLTRTWSYPRVGYLAYGAPVRIAASILSFLPNRYPGDLLCFEIRRAEG